MILSGSKLGRILFIVAIAALLFIEVMIFSTGG